MIIVALQPWQCSKYLCYDLQDAVKALNTLQTNAQALAQIRQEQGRLVHNKLREMVDFTERAGVSV